MIPLADLRRARACATVAPEPVHFGSVVEPGPFMCGKTSGNLTCRLALITCKDCQSVILSDKWCPWKADGYTPWNPEPPRYVRSGQALTLTDHGVREWNR